MMINMLDVLETSLVFDVHTKLKMYSTEVF